MSLAASYKAPWQAISMQFKDTWLCAPWKECQVLPLALGGFSVLHLLQSNHCV